MHVKVKDQRLDYSAHRYIVNDRLKEGRIFTRRMGVGQEQGPLERLDNSSAGEYIIL